MVAVVLTPAAVRALGQTELSAFAFDLVQPDGAGARAKMGGVEGHTALAVRKP